MKVEILTMFYGQEHLDMLFGSLLPSLLLPDNVPELMSKYEVTHYLYCSPNERQILEKEYENHSSIPIEKVNSYLLNGPNPRNKLFDCFRAACTRSVEDGRIIVMAPCDHVFGHGLAKAVQRIEKAGQYLLCGHPRVTQEKRKEIETFVRSEGFVKADNKQLVRLCMEEWQHPMVEYGKTSKPLYWHTNRHKDHWETYFSEPPPLAFRASSSWNTALNSNGWYGLFEIIDHDLVEVIYKQGDLLEVLDSNEFFWTEITSPEKYNPTINSNWECASVDHFRKTPLIWRF